MRELILAGIGLAVVALLAIIVQQNYTRFHKPQITTRYQAVTLVDGSVFYGRIAHLGSDHPVLRDAMTIDEQPDPQTQQPQRTLKRLRDDLRGGDHLIFPATSILHVEPVQPDSAIGRLIEMAATSR